MDGYYFDQYDKSCVILISDFSNGENIETLTATEIDRLYGNMRSLVESCINGYILKKGSYSLRLIQLVRDEAHRFAITFNRPPRKSQL